MTMYKNKQTNKQTKQTKNIVHRDSGSVENEMHVWPSNSFKYIATLSMLPSRVSG